MQGDWEFGHYVDFWGETFESQFKQILNELAVFIQKFYLWSSQCLSMILTHGRIPISSYKKEGVWNEISFKETFWQTSREFCISFIQINHHVKSRKPEITHQELLSTLFLNGPVVPRAKDSYYSIQ